MNRFKVGQILRYDAGETALMRVSYVSKNHGGRGVHRYYGQQCMGGSIGVYEDQCELSSKKDREVWKEVRQQYTDILSWRKFLQRGRAVVGIVED